MRDVTSLEEFRGRRNRPRVEWLTYQELSDRLGRSVRQLKRDRAAGMPVAVRFPGRLLFDEAEVLGWFERVYRKKESN